MAIHQEILIKAAPAAVYRALTDAAEFSALTGGAPAHIAAEAGGTFGCFGDKITGRHIELVAARRIVQAWRAGNWPEGIYSVVRLELRPEGGGTRIVFDQVGHPDDQEPHLDAGWHRMYWEPLQRHLG